MQILNVVSRSPWRITVVTDTAPDLTATDYAITRLDGAATNSTVAHAFQSPDGAHTAELTVGTAPLVDGVVYVLSLPTQPGAPSAQVAYRQPLLQSQVPVAPDEDPEAEAFGVDVDWWADGLTANGDTPVIRGRQCFVNDLAVISMVNKGEIFHRPDAGAGVALDTNSPMTGARVREVAGKLTREWYKDPRTRPGGVDVRVDQSASTGVLKIYGRVTPLAVDDPLVVKLPGGGT